MAEPVLLVRFRRGFVGEARRAVHVVPVPAGDDTPARLTAYCGQEFAPGQAEVVVEPGRGMPCVTCLAAAPVPGLEGGLPAGGSR